MKTRSAGGLAAGELVDYPRGNPERAMTGPAARPPALLFLLALATSTVSAQAQSPRTWTANWIWDRPATTERNVYTYFRKTFSLSQPATSATLYITADSRYQIFVNGIYVGRGPVRAPAGRLYYDTYDIKPLLRSGPNVIAAVVHFFGDGNESYLPGRGGFLAEATIALPTGPPLVLATDASWRTLRSAAWLPSPRENDSNGFLEIFDSRQEPAGWTAVEFSDASWSAPSVIGPPPQEPWPLLLPRDIPTLTESDLRPAAITRAGQVTRGVPSNPILVAEQVQMETIVSPVSVEFTNLGNLLLRNGPPTTIRTYISGEDAAIVLDFGRIVAGFPYIDVEGPAGAIVDVSFSEWLRNGQVTSVKSPVRFQNYNGRPMYTTDRIGLRGGRQRWQRFFHSSFRYIQLTLRQAWPSVTVHQVGATFHAYPYPSGGSFRSSDDLLNRIWQTGAYTVLLSTSDVIMDCPWREKGQWMDMVAPMVNYYAFGDRAIVARFLRTTSFAQDADGRMSFPYPSTVHFEMPDQTMWWGMHLWQYYLHFGDVALLQELYPVLTKAAAWFRNHRSARGLLDVNWPFPPDRLLWPWIDHGHRSSANYPGFKLGEMAALDALYYKFLTDAANIARTVSLPADGAAFDAEAQQLKAAFNANYWDAALGFYWDDVPHTWTGEYAGVLAVLYGLAPADRWQPIMQRVLDANYSMGRASPHFYFFILDALAKTNLYDEAIAAMRKRWGDLLNAGATTFWEHWTMDLDLFGRPWPSGENSHISQTHGYAAVPTYILSTISLGVRPMAGGFSRFAVAPMTNGLTRAEGAVPTPWGQIQVSWQNSPFSLAVRVPGGTAAWVSVPRGPADEVRVNGTLVWRSGRVVGSAPPVRVVGPTGNRLVLDAPGGYYQFASQ